MSSNFENYLSIRLYICQYTVDQYTLWCSQMKAKVLNEYNFNLNEFMEIQYELCYQKLPLINRCKDKIKYFLIN